MLDLYGSEVGVRVARKHIGWYTKGLTGSAEFRNYVNRIDDPAVVIDELTRFYAPQLDAVSRVNMAEVLHRPESSQMLASIPVPVLLICS